MRDGRAYIWVVGRRILEDEEVNSMSFLLDITTHIEVTGPILALVTIPGFELAALVL